MNRIMLRFRPIAPKPAGGEAIYAEQESLTLKNGRRMKRKYVRVRGRQSRKRKSGKSSPSEKSGIEEDSSPETGLVTLQLLPERSESCDNSAPQKIEGNRIIDRYFCVGDDVRNKELDPNGGAGVGCVTESWIIVECVTDTFTNAGVGLGFSDREKIDNLQGDECPGFVSDRTNNVVWVNEAYRKMLQAGENGFMVWLVVKEILPHFCPSFACRAKLVQHTKQGHKWNKIVPCDVWRMEFTGFAWKLDVNNALGLGI